MAIDIDRVLHWEFPEVRQRYDERDCMLYALGLGIGSDPLDPGQLRYVYERNLEVFPTMPTVIATPGFWLQDPRTGIDWRRAVAAEQSVTLHRPIPVSATVVGRMQVTGLFDKGADKGALLTYRRQLFLDGTVEPLCSIEGSTFLRGDGGFGLVPGSVAASPVASLEPARTPDSTISIGTLPQAALIHRLSGDRNPLHADPEAARKAGFARPILHGLCSYGIACRAVMLSLTRTDRTLSAFACRFASPVYPGETLVIDVWYGDDGKLSFSCRTAERGAQVLTAGRATVRSGDSAAAVRSGP